MFLNIFHFDPQTEDVKKFWEELVERKIDLDQQQERIDVLLQDAFEQVITNSMLRSQREISISSISKLRNKSAEHKFKILC